jgi:hypothetical protein
MPDFSKFADEAKNLASDHPDMANKGIDEAGQAADEKTGGRFGSPSAMERLAKAYTTASNVPSGLPGFPRIRVKPSTDAPPGGS